MYSTMEADNMARAPQDSTAQAANDAQWSHPLRVSDLAQRKATQFSIIPNAPVLAAILASLELIGLKKLRFEGQLSPSGKTDWSLTAKLGATVTQPCVVTLIPVTTRLDMPVERHFIADHSVFAEEAGDDVEVEMDPDETREPLRGIIDPGEIMLEALALALPLYPRADGAALESAQFAAPGTVPMQDEDARPFAGLANLLKTGEKPSKEE